ncbi:unnamed protein product [Protopolystoma xenopodis]|uniref:Uncharacterized protein n=1 Tax=Protopolystoma xenopodis TaxID=117903 RepID=A0A448WUW2_9PLAT|nr:unnamed protein product [Protopolystoma xenopodis]
MIYIIYGLQDRSSFRSHYHLRSSSSVANRSPTKINSAPAIASKKRPLVNGGKASKTSKRGPPAKSIKKSHSDVEASSSHSGGSSTEEEHPSQEEEEEEEEDELTDRCCSPSNITTEDYTGKKRGASVGKRKCSSVRPVPNVTEGIATGAKKRNSSLAALAIGASTTIGRASTGITGSKKTSSLGASAGRRRVARSRSRSSSVSSNASSESLRAGDVGSSSHSSLSSDALRDSGKPGAGGSSFSRYCSHSTCLADGDTLHTAGASSTMLRRPPFAPPISTVGGATNVGGLSGQTGSSSGDATSGSAAPGSQLIGSHHHHHHHGHGHGHSSSTSVGGVVSSATSSSTHEAMLAAATCLAGSNHPLAGALGQAASGLLNVSGAGASGTLQPPIGFSTVPRSHLPPNKRAAAAAAAAALGAGSNIGLIDTTGFSALTGNLASPGPARIDAFTAATGLMPSTGTSLSGHGFSSSVATGAGSSPGSQVSPASAPQLIKRMASKAIQVIDPTFIINLLPLCFNRLNPYLINTVKLVTPYTYAYLYPLSPLDCSINCTIIILFLCIISIFVGIKLCRISRLTLTHSFEE